MVKTNYKELMIEINDFEKFISDKYKADIKIHFKFYKVSLLDLSTVVNRVYFKHTIFAPKEGIFLKSNKDEIIMFRSLFYLKAREFGFSLHEIGKFISKNHSSVLNGYRKAKMKVKKENKDYCSILKKINDLL